MPVCPIPVGVGDPVSFEEWRLIDHLCSPQPYVYSIPSEHITHRFSALADETVLTFPHLATVCIGNGVDWKYASHPDREEIFDTRDFIQRATGPGAYAVARTASNLVVAAAAQLVVAYCIHGAGRNDTHLLSEVFGGPLHVSESLLQRRMANQILQHGMESSDDTQA